MAGYNELIDELEELKDEIIDHRNYSNSCRKYIPQLKAENEALRKALSDLLDLYDTDEGCRNLPQYIAGRAALGHPRDTVCDAQEKARG